MPGLGGEAGPKGEQGEKGDEVSFTKSQWVSTANWSGFRQGTRFYTQFYK